MSAVPKTSKSQDFVVADQSLAGRIGAAGKEVAMKRFNIHRFVNDWENLFEKVTHRKNTPGSIFIKGICPKTLNHLRSEYEEEENRIY